MPSTHRQPPSLGVTAARGRVPSRARAPRVLFLPTFDHCVEVFGCSNFATSGVPERKVPPRRVTPGDGTSIITPDRSRRSPLSARPRPRSRSFVMLLDAVSGILAAARLGRAGEAGFSIGQDALRRGVHRPDGHSLASRARFRRFDVARGGRHLVPPAGRSSHVAFVARDLAPPSSSTDAMDRASVRPRRAASLAARDPAERRRVRRCHV